MTETTPAPQEQAVAAPNSAMAPDAVAPDYFIPQATRDNYAQIARDQAAVQGREPREVMQEFADQWEQLHGRQPLDGYDHLAAWAREFDPAASAGPTGLAVLQARVIESARRDPYQAVIGDQAAVQVGIDAQRVQDEVIGTATAAPSVDPASGFLPNAGILPVPPDVTIGQPGAEVPQGVPSPGVETPDGEPDAPSSATGGAVPGTAPAPAPSSSGEADKSKTDKGKSGSDQS